MLYAHHTQALAHYAPVVVAEASEESRVRAAPHGSHLKHGEVLHLRPLREHHSDEPRQFLTGERVNLSLAEHYLSAELRLEGGDGAQQGGLSHSVVANKTSEATGMQGSFNTLHHHSPVCRLAISDREIGKSQYVFHFNSFSESVVSASSACPLLHVAHLDEIFGNLNGVQCGTLANLVAGEPQRVAVVVGKILAHTAHIHIIVAGTLQRHRIYIVLRVVFEGHSRRCLQCLADFLHGERTLGLEPHAL